MKRQIPFVLLISVFLLTVVSTAAGQIIYVDADAAGNNNGSSWADAFNYLQDALTAAQSGDEIWVAEGTYKPNEGSHAEDEFALRNGVTVKGGYAGFGEPDPNARDIELYETILSGDLAGNDVDVNDPRDLWSEPTRADNKNVFWNYNCNETAILDGFIITGGRSLSGGGGMRNRNSSPTIINCTFSANTAGDDGVVGGGAILNLYSNPTLINCTFSGNSAGDGGSGGGMYNDSSNPTLTNCTFTGNTAEYCGGGIMNGGGSSPTVTNCTFANNFADFRGGGMHNDSGSFNPILTNCTFIGNQSDEDGGGMFNIYSSPTLRNCTFSGNFSESGGGGMKNIYSSPILIDCSFSGNYVEDGFGGGMDNSYNSSPTLTNCTFSQNSAGEGGGMFNDESSPSLTNCAFTGNSTESNGGGFYSDDDSAPEIANCKITGNSANNGAGIYCHTGTTIENCTISANTAVQKGGGVYYVLDPISPPPFPIPIPWPGPPQYRTNSSYKAQSESRCPTRLRSIGKALDLPPVYEPKITNCILWDNTAEQQPQIAVESSYQNPNPDPYIPNPGQPDPPYWSWIDKFKSSEAKSSDEQAESHPYKLDLSPPSSLPRPPTWPPSLPWPPPWLPPWLLPIPPEYPPVILPLLQVTYSDIQGGWESQTNIDADPGFVQPGYWDVNDVWVDGDYHLLPGSPCIDAGDPNYIAGPNETDLGGLPRVFGGRIDMGAYEFSSIEARLWLFPQVINRHNRMKRIMAWVHLPEGVTKDQVDENEPVLLYPGGIEPMRQYVFEHGKRGNKRVSIFAFYDKVDLMAAVSDSGAVDLEVIGSLNTGQYFHGSDTVRIIGRR